VRLLLGTLFLLIVAVAVGLGTTYYALSRGADFGGLTVGHWTAHAKTGTTDADPYARASIARSGRLPLALGDGLTFIAKSDDSNRPLDGRCDVVLSGLTPAARFWTLTLYNTEGDLVANSAHRHGFTSEEIVRHPDGHFDIMVAPRANPGNWLPTGGIERYILAMRFYDTSVGVSTKEGREIPMPTIKTRSCR
jgi:hypothetical protein